MARHAPLWRATRPVPAPGAGAQGREPLGAGAPLCAPFRPRLRPITHPSPVNQRPPKISTSPQPILSPDGSFSLCRRGRPDRRTGSQTAPERLTPITDGTGSPNGAAPVAPLAPAAPKAPAAPARKAAPLTPRGAAALTLGKSLDGAASGSVNYHTMRGVSQTGDGTRLHAVLLETGDGYRFGYSLRSGGDFVTLGAPSPKGANASWQAGAALCAPYTVAGIKTVVAMLASLDGRTKNRSQSSAPVTVAGHLPPKVAALCGLPTVTKVDGARRGGGRTNTV